MKKLAATAITLLFFASSASAQVILNASENARMLGMGVGNEQIEDDFNIFINPAQVNNYKNTVYAEFGTYAASDSNSACGGIACSAINSPNEDGIPPESQWGGANLDASYGTWGIYIGRPAEESATNIMADSSGATGVAPTNNRLDLFYGLAGAPVGVYLSYAERSHEDEVAGVKTEDSASEINFGLGGIFMGGNLEAALNISLPDLTCKGALGICPAFDISGDAAPSLALLGRHHAPVAGGKLLSTLQVAAIDGSTKEKVGNTKREVTGTFISLGTALNANPVPDALVVIGLGIEVSSFERKDKSAGVSQKITEDTFSIPLNVGVEHQTFSKVKTRFGISKPLLKTTECKNQALPLATDCLTGGFVQGNKHTEVDDGAASVSAGIGWSPIESFMLDFVINQDVIFSGTYALSGVSESLSSVVSATYRFQ